MALQIQSGSRSGACAEAPPASIPQGWYRIGKDGDDEAGEVWHVRPGDAVWDPDTQSWLTLLAHDEPPWSQIRDVANAIIIRRMLPKVPLPSAETPHALVALQRKMEAAIKQSQDIELEGRTPQIVASGPLGPRYDGAGNIVLTATAIQPDELAEYIANNPIFSKRHLGYIPPGTDPSVAVLYVYWLKRIPDEDRAKLYEQGGMQAVRDMAMRLAKHALSQIPDDQKESAHVEVVVPAVDAPGGERM